MSGIAYPPPSELLPIFNSTVYTSDSNNQYLNFPVAQGAETITTLATTNFTLNNTKFSLGSGSSATLSNQISIGASTNSIYIPAPLRSITEIDLGSTNISYLTRREVGVFVMNSNISYELPYSIPDLRNQTQQPFISGNLPTGVLGQTAKGIWGSHSVDNINELFIVHPNYGLIGYDDYNYGTTENINYQNNTLNPVFVATATGTNNTISSVRIYYKGVELLRQPTN